ncbi:MAG TPA: ABC transporter permease [Kineosporiaceae bacterium]|nr:ABC transporter permease [Kineosporiaceae bacterium]
MSALAVPVDLTTAPPLPAATRLPGRDLGAVGLAGLRGRPLRAALSALGIAIGIAAMVAVLGISTASRAGLLAQIRSLGTNLLTVTPGQSMFGDEAYLPVAAPGMISRIPGVNAVSAVGVVADATVRRTDAIDPDDSGGIGVLAAQEDLVTTLGGSLQAGTWLNAATAQYPAVVLGSVAAERLGIDRTDLDNAAAAGGDGNRRVFLGGRWFTVIGILNSLPLAPDIDRSVLIGWPVAEQLLGFNGHPTTIYERSDDDAVEAVRSVLAATVDPENPDQVGVSQPSDALTAQLAAGSAFDSLFLGLGAVALLVGGVGIANIMVISVLERRQEIGLRRALGATRRHIRLQFLTESVLLSMLGGVVGVALGLSVTLSYAAYRDWPLVLPTTVLIGGVLIAVLIGAVAGLYPARRAARLAPTEALATG